MNHEGIHRLGNSKPVLPWPGDSNRPALFPFQAVYSVKFYANPPGFPIYASC